jgi:hypothetical protein
MKTFGSILQIAVCKSTMEQAASSTAPLSRAFTCSSCGCTVPAQVCENGNVSFIYGRCNALQPDGSRCNFFQWTSPDNGSYTSPNLTSQAPAFPPSLPMRPFAYPSGVPLLTTCTAPCCMILRIHPLCERKQCRKHCIASGGCSVKGHSVPAATLNSPKPYFAAQSTILPLLPSVTVVAPATLSDSASTSTATPVILPSTPSAAMTPPATLSDSASTSTATQTIAPPGVFDPPSSGAVLPASQVSASTQPTSQAHVNPYLVPRFSSQMPAIFTTQLAREQELNERRRNRDAQRLENVRKAKNRVVAYGWYRVWTVFYFCCDCLSTPLRMALNQLSSSFKVDLSGHTLF